MVGREINTLWLIYWHTHHDRQNWGPEVSPDRGFNSNFASWSLIIVFCNNCQGSRTMATQWEILSIIKSIANITFGFLVGENKPCLDLYFSCLKQLSIVPVGFCWPCVQMCWLTSTILHSASNPIHTNLFMCSSIAFISDFRLKHYTWIMLSFLYGYFKLLRLYASAHNPKFLRPALPCVHAKTPYLQCGVGETWSSE